jgi:ABC-type Fe3+ transport system permease subunit
MPFWFRVLVGMGGSIIGGAIAGAIYDASHTFDNSNHAFVTLLVSLALAFVILVADRRLVRRRPLSGRMATAFLLAGSG